MKRVLVSLLFVYITYATAALTGEDIVRFQKARGECLRDNKVDQSVLLRATRGELVEDQQFDCFLGCLLKKNELLKPDNSVDKELAISKVPKEAAFGPPLIKAIENCSSMKDSDVCRAAHLVYACLHENKVPALFVG